MINAGERKGRTIG